MSTIQKNNYTKRFIRICSQLLILLAFSGSHIFGQVIDISIPGTGEGINVGSDDLKWSYYGYWNTSPGIQFTGEPTRSDSDGAFCVSGQNHEVEYSSEVPFDENGIVHGGATVYFYYSFTVAKAGTYHVHLNATGVGHNVDIAKWVGISNGGDMLGMQGVVSHASSHSFCESFDLTANLTPGDHMVRIGSFMNGPSVPARITVGSLGGGEGSCVPALMMTSTNNVTIPNGGSTYILFTSTTPATYSWVTAGNPNTSKAAYGPYSSNALIETITNYTTVPQTVTYTVTPNTSNGGCPGIPQTVTVTINPPPLSCLSADFDYREFCYEERITLGVTCSTLNLQADDRCDWNFGSGPIITNTQALSEAVKLYLVPGEYDVTCTLRQANGCPTTSKTKKIYFDSEPIHSLSASPTTVVVNENVTFNFSAYLPHHLQDKYTLKLDFGDGSPIITTTANTVSKAFSTPGIYTVTFKANGPDNPYCVVQDQVIITVVDCQVGCDPIECKDCIGSFAPIPEQQYLISVWVQQAGNEQETSYNGPGITLDFTGGGVPSETFRTTPGSPIIDGWQRIDGTFKVPKDATDVYVKLINTSANEVYFDDLRIQPLKASLKSFVYDPVSMRLMAELDENNYATFYEYDEEGALIRVKKETERGIKTIKETGNNTRKK